MLKWLMSLFGSKQCPHKCEGSSPKSDQTHLYAECRDAKSRGLCSSLSRNAIKVTDSFNGPRSGSGAGITD